MLYFKEFVKMFCFYSFILHTFFLKTPDGIASFILNNPSLSRTQIGEYFGTNGILYLH
jgi:hypothetical protein